MINFIAFIFLLILFAISCIYVTENNWCWFTLILSCIFLCSLYSHATDPSDQYYLGAELYTSKDNTYIFVDEDGNFWEWEDDMYIYTDQHIYLLTMDTNGTYNTVKDDIILTVWSSGGEEIPTVG